MCSSKLNLHKFSQIIWSLTKFTEVLNFFSEGDFLFYM